MPSTTATADAVIKRCLNGKTPDRQAFLDLKRTCAGDFGTPIPDTPELRKAYERAVRRDPSRRDEALERLLVRRGVRSLSGVAVVTVLTKAYPCPGRCVYCPKEARMPKSYLSNEPAAARALANRFDPFAQVATRLRQLSENGHPVDKIELIVKGGTWSSYPWTYQRRFIKRCFDACNAYGSGRRRTGRTLLESQRINEGAVSRIIGMTLETRPDRITPAEIARLRELGCTRIELGVQSVDDRILSTVKRDHDTETVRAAAVTLKDAGYKCDFHMMPQLPGATPVSDVAQIRTVFEDPGFRPDMIKIYPCVVLDNTELKTWHEEGSYQPYSDEALVETLIEAKTHVPRYCRISRLIRDIPSTSIIAGNGMTNLRQVIQAKMDERGISCACLRCREFGRAVMKTPSLARCTPKLFIDEYEASGGHELFLSYEDAARRTVFAFCRLRLPSREPDRIRDELFSRIPEIRNAAFIRELHTYGHLVPISARDAKAAQHKGHGRRLMAEAERIAAEAGFPKMAVISGVGVRGYYRKLGYRLQGTYMVKRLLRREARAES